MSDLISKKELYHKLGEAYIKGYLSWGANEIFKDIIGGCDSVENKGDLISRQAIDDVIAEIKSWYWQADRQALAKDPCVVDAMVDMFLRTIDKHISGKENE